MSTPDVELSIQLDGSQEIYHSGETVKGVVVARVNRFLKVSVVKVELEGLYTYRYKHGGFHEQNITNAEVKLGMGGKVSDIDAGIYNSPFSFTLDPSLPSSLVCLAGSVEYKIVAQCGYNLTCGSSIAKTEAVKYFSVNRYLDLIDKPLALVGAVIKHSHQTGGMCSWCCGSEIVISMETKKRAFVAGERIEVSASIDNDTSHVISKTELDVIQKVKTRFNLKVKQKVVVQERGMVMSYSHQVWINESLLVPSVPPTSEDYNMTVSYILRMVLTIDNGKLIKLQIPIVIGNVPVDTNIVEGAVNELSFMYWGEIYGGDVVQNFIPSYIVYRFSPGAFPSAPAVEEPAT